jgi:uncharacterized protein (TIGR02594 family)
MSKYKVTANKLNVRSEPGISGDIIGVLDMDNVVEVIDTAENGWHQIKWPDGPAWASHKYLVGVEGEQANTFKVMAHRLNVRSEPALTGQIIGVLNKNEIVEVVGTSEDAYWYKIKLEEGFGWSSHKYFVSVEKEHEITDEEFPWMPIAVREVGTKEFAGEADNPRIVQYLRSTSLSENLSSNDETAWCSAFVNWCVEQSGYAGTDSAWARDWANWGKATDTPRRGCIVVLTRGDGGHVGFYVGETDSHIKILGGNQSNSVRVSNYPKNRLISYRVPA